MQKNVLTTVFYLLLLTSFLHSTQNLGENLIPVSGLKRGTLILPYTEGISTNVDYEFVVEPTTIMTSYYDYMPGGFFNYPIQKQYINGSGTYLTFHAKDSTTSNRRQYSAYLNENGILQYYNTISTYNEQQGYGDIAIHQSTGNCLASWHENPSAANYGVTLCYDDFSLINVPGFWSSVTFVPSPLPDEYIWPRLYTGPSPQGDNWMRLYHISQNTNPNSFGYPINDVRIMYIDVENTISADLSQILNVSNWTTITPMYSWRHKSCQINSLCFAVDESNPGKVGMLGYCKWLEGDLGNMPVNPGLFIWESDDYGESWDYVNLHSQSQGQDPTLYQVENQPQFEFNGVVPDYLDVDVFGFNNTSLYDEWGNLHGTLLASYYYTDSVTKNRYYLEHFMPQIEVVWEHDNYQFSFEEIPRLPGNDSFSGQSVPWEIVGNDTILYVVVTYAGDSYGDKQSNALHSSLTPYPYLHCWSDATYSTLAQLGYTDYIDYLEHPLIYIGARGVWGGYKLLELTDINNPNFDFSDQITIYPYLDENIVEHDTNFWGKVLLYYYDDNSFGSHVLGYGDNSGGNINYCEVDIYFYFYDVDDDVEFSNIKVTNFPNPVVTQTNISFSSTKPIRYSSVTIYNAKGQYVKTLESQNGITPTEGYAVWDGTDMNGKNVRNGIYFYKVDIDESLQINKMLLTR